MPSESTQRAIAFRDEVLGKLNQTVQDFADGKLSREQFQTIYARYTERLTMANIAVLSGQDEAITEMENDGTSTVAVRDSLQAKAVGLMIYHNNSGTILETLGEPDVPIEVIGPLLNDLSGRMAAGEHIDPVVQRISERQWLVLTAGRGSTVAMQFRNEPALVQIREIERLHRDFETANRAALSRSTTAADTLAYPFLTFIEKRIR